MKPLKDQRGIALILVIWLLVILAALAAELAMTARGDIGAARNYKEGREAHYLARAGVQMAMAELLEDYDYVYLKGGAVRFGRKGDEAAAPEFSPRSGIPFGGGVVSYAITDESGKLNINDLARNEGALRPVFKTLFPEGLDGEDEMVDGIIDWVDADDYHRAFGAESDHYQTLAHPYFAKNGDLSDLGELKRVRGMTEMAYQQLGKILTVFPAGPLNRNTAAPEALLAAGVPPDQVDAIMSAREKDALPDPAGTSFTFTIVATGRFEGSPLTQSVKAVVRKTAPRRLVILAWSDDWYETPAAPTTHAISATQAPAAIPASRATQAPAAKETARK